MDWICEVLRDSRGLHHAGRRGDQEKKVYAAPVLTKLGLVRIRTRNSHIGNGKLPA